MHYLKLAVFISGAACALPAFAQSGRTLSAEMRLERMLRCQDIADLPARASCYDNEARQARDASGASAPAAAPPATVAVPASGAAAPAPRANLSFGIESVDAARRPQPKAAEERQMSAYVASRSASGPGLWLYELDNDTQWRTTETSPWDLPRPGDEITIRRSAMGGYMMDVGRRAAVRVTRVF